MLYRGGKLPRRIRPRMKKAVGHTLAKLYTLAQKIISIVWEQAATWHGVLSDSILLHRYCGQASKQTAHCGPFERIDWSFFFFETGKHTDITWLYIIPARHFPISAFDVCIVEVHSG